MNTIHTAPYLATANQDEHLLFMGGEVIVHLTGKQTAGQAFISTSIYGPGLGVPLHTHTHEDESFYVIEGTLEIVVGEQTVTVGAGASAFLPRGIPHAWKVVGDRPAKFILTVTPSGMEELFRDLAAMPPGAPDPQRINDICTRYDIAFA